MCLLVDNLKQHPCLLQTATKKSLCVPSSIHYTMPGPTVNFKTDLINAREQNFKGKIYKNPGKIPTKTYIVYSFSNIFPHFFIHIYFSEHKKKTSKTVWPLFMSQGQTHLEEAVYFLPPSSQKFLVLILSTSKG